MIIILEGPDGSGKTTLANQLSRQTGYPIVHRVKPETEEEKQQMLDEYVKAIRTNKNIIFDRCWYSEMAYGPVMRDKTYISYPGMYELERRLSRVGALLIYCTGSKTMLWDRCKQRGEEYITAWENFSAICDNFDTIMTVPHLIPVVRYEYKEV